MREPDVRGLARQSESRLTLISVAFRAASKPNVSAQGIQLIKEAAYSIML